MTSRPSPSSKPPSPSPRPEPRAPSTGAEADIPELDIPEIETEVPAATPRPVSGTLYEGAPPAAAKVSTPTEFGVHSVAAVRNLFQSVDKTMKQLNLYDGRGEACERALTATYEQLQVVVRKGELELTVTPYELLLGDQSVYQSDEDKTGLTYRLFRDGVRRLTFLPRVERGELASLLDVMRSAHSERGEVDSVTLLWEKDLPGIKHRAIDLFLEGYEEQLTEITDLADGPLLSGPSVGVSIPPAGLAELKAQLTMADLQTRRATQAELLAGLARQPLEGQLAGLQPLLATIQEDAWRRAMGIFGRLLQTGDDTAKLGVLLGRILDELQRASRWDMLGVACRTIGQLSRGSEDKAASTLDRILASALADFCTIDRLTALEPMLETCSLGDFELICELLKILPTQANTNLVLLLARMPEGEKKEKLAALLLARGANLFEYYRQQLRDSNNSRVLGAIAALKALGTPPALQALRGIISQHSHPKVRLEALRAVRGSVDKKAIPEILACMSLDHRELLDLCYEILSTLPGREHTGELLRQIKHHDFDEWPSTRRRRVLQLLAVWGGTEANDFIVGRIVTSNLFGRQKVELGRKEMIEAVAAVGGKRARAIFDASLQSRPSEGTRITIQTAMKTMEPHS